MKYLYIKIILKFLLYKLGRDRVPTSGESARNNDDLFIHVYGFDEHHPDKAATILSMKGNEIECCRTELDNSETCATIKIADLSSYKVSVLYFFKTWRITYDNIYEPFWHLILGINYLKLVFQKQYDKSLQFYNDRIGLLKLLVEKQRSTTANELNYYEILTEIYGPRIHTSDENYLHYKNIRQLLLSLKESGDLELEDKVLHVDKIKVLPTALKTLADYEIEQTRHIDSIKIIRYQLIVAILLALLTAANVYYTFTSNKESITSQSSTPANNAGLDRPNSGRPLT